MSAESGARSAEGGFNLWKIPTSAFRIPRSAFALTFFCLLPLHLYAQGILPPKAGPPTATPQAEKYLLIDEHVPDSITVIDANGKVRPLLTYKSALDVLVVGFYSPSCSYNQDSWTALKRFYDSYKEWNVAFVGVSATPNERLSDLADAMLKAGLTYPAVRDERQRAAVKLNATATPEILIIDEWGNLRYRGPLHDAIQTPGKKPHIEYARDALEAVIGHVDPVPSAEPGDFIGCPINP